MHNISFVYPPKLFIIMKKSLTESMKRKFVEYLFENLITHINLEVLPIYLDTKLSSYTYIYLCFRFIMEIFKCIFVRSSLSHLK